MPINRAYLHFDVRVIFMKIAYINLIMSPSAGIANKLDKQAKLAQELELPFDFYWITSLAGHNNNDYKYVITKKVEGTNPFIIRKRQGEIIHQLLDNYDRLILRYPMFDPVLFLKIRERNRIILEHHTKEIPELKLNGDKRWITEALFGGRWIHGFAALTAVTKEILNYEVQRAKFKKRTAFFPNSIDVNSYVLNGGKVKSSQTESVKLIMVASDFSYPWHGLDKIISVMEKASLKIPYELHLVGKINEHLSMKIKQVNNITYHGIKQPWELRQLYENMHVGIGSFNIEVKNLNEGVPLKVREYLAMGLPVVLGYSDPAIPDDFPFKLQLTTFDLEKIIEFVKANQNIERFDIREAARPYIDSKIITRQLYRFSCDI